MKFKKTFPLLCLIICLFCMVSVCAEDINDSVMSEKDNAQIDYLNELLRKSRGVETVQDLYRFNQ